MVCYTYLYIFIGLERFGTGSGVPTLSINDVHAFQIPLPLTQEEQKAIAQIASLRTKARQIQSLQTGHDARIINRENSRRI